MDHLKELTAKQRDKREKREKKSVMFSGDVESDDEEDMPRKPLFPKGKKTVDEELTEVKEAGEEPLSDPRVAALARAKKRESDKEVDDVELLDDVQEAEEDFKGQEGDEENEIEPFNLKKEREEGYFDADGNYVEYRTEKKVTDAWLESTEVDERYAAKAAEMAANAEAAPEELTSEQLGSLKRRIADALEPGETVFLALKRLGGDQRRPKVKGRKPAVKMDPEKKKIFDQLTEDSMKLTDSGDYNVYSEKKESFEREAEGYEALARARSQPSSSKRGSDMFADSDDEGKENAEPQKRRRTGPDSEEQEADIAQQQASQEASQQVSEVTTEPAEREYRDEGTNRLSEEMVPDLVPGAETGYVYDEASGYYYNSEFHYYYDSKTSQYCNAATGIWYRYDPSSNSYIPVYGNPQA